MGLPSASLCSWAPALLCLEDGPLSHPLALSGPAYHPSSVDYVPLGKPCPHLSVTVQPPPCSLRRRGLEPLSEWNTCICLFSEVLKLRCSVTASPAPIRAHSLSSVTFGATWSVSRPCDCTCSEGAGFGLSKEPQGGTQKVTTLLLPLSHLCALS